MAALAPSQPWQLPARTAVEVLISAAAANGGDGGDEAGSEGSFAAATYAHFSDEVEAELSGETLLQARLALRRRRFVPSSLFCESNMASHR